MLSRVPINKSFIYFFIPHSTAFLYLSAHVNVNGYLHVIIPKLFFAVLHLFAKSPSSQIAKLAELHNNTKLNYVLLESFPASSTTTISLSFFKHIYCLPYVHCLLYFRMFSFSLFHLYSLTCLSVLVFALHNYILSLSIILYNFFPQVVKIRFLFLFAFSWNEKV